MYQWEPITWPVIIWGYLGRNFEEKMVQMAKTASTPGFSGPQIAQKYNFCPEKDIFGPLKPIQTCYECFLVELGLLEPKISILNLNL